MYLNFGIERNNIQSLKDQIATKDNAIQTYKDSLQINSELTKKTQLLKDYISKDVDPQRFFDFSKKIQESLKFATTVKKYSRNDDGSFNIDFSFSGLENADELIQAFEQYPEAKSVNAKSISKNDRNEVLISINFSLINEGQNKQLNG
jgi:hypothetical protein